jgi:hypothetical protein
MADNVSLYKLQYTQTNTLPPPTKKGGTRRIKINRKFTYKKLHNLFFSPNTVTKIGGWREHGT